MLLLDGMSDCMIFHIFVEESVGLWVIRNVITITLGTSITDEIYISGRRYNVYDIAGMTTLDYLELYKKLLIRHKSHIDWIILQI